MSSPDAGKTSLSQAPGPWEIFSVFFKLGLTAFGGPAMITHIRESVVEKKGWLSDTSFKDGIAICQTLPGAIAVNVASYAGYRTKGITGLLLSFLGFSLPAFGLMVFLSIIYKETRAMPAADAIFTGLAVVVISIIGHATMTFGRQGLKTPADYGLAVMSALLLFLNTNPFLVIMLGGGLGIFLFRQYPRENLPTDTYKRGSFRDAALLLTGFAGVLLLLWLTSPNLFELGRVMAKIELFAFGGGYTAITLMFHEVVEARSWMDHQTLLDGVALGQLTPGPILNTATFIGYFTNGFTGAVIGTLGIFFPGLILVVGVLPIFDRLRGSAFFPRIIRGIIACFVGLLLYVTIKFAVAVNWEIKHLLLLIASFGALYKKVDLLWVVGCAGLASYFLFQNSF